MKYLILKTLMPIYVLFFVAVSCGGKGWDSGYSNIGFYYTPEESIASLDTGKNLSAGEHFILANSYKDKNELKKAAVHFANSAFIKERNLSLKPYPSTLFQFATSWNSKSDFYEDAVLEIGHILFKYAEYDYARKFSDLVSDKDLSLFREAIILKERTYEVTKKYDDAVKVINDNLYKFENTGMSPVLLIRKASAYQKKGEFAKSVETYMESLSITADGWQGATAAKEIYSMIKSGKASYPKNSIVIAQSLLTANELDSCRTVLQFCSPDYQKDRVSACLLYITGRRKDAEQIISKYQDISSERAAILQSAANIYWDRGNKRDAVLLIKDLVKIPQFNSKNEHRKMCYYLYENNHSDASVYLSLYASRYSSDRSAERMLWFAAKPYIEKKDFSTAKEFLIKQIKLFPVSSFSGNARFWLYKIALSEKKPEEAERYFKEMPAFSPSSPYTIILLYRNRNDYDESELLSLFSNAISTKNETAALFAHAMLFIKNSDRAERNNRLSKINSSGLNRFNELSHFTSINSLSSSKKDILLSTEKYFATGHTEGIQRVLNSFSSEKDNPADKDSFDKDKSLIVSQFGGKYFNYYQQLTGTEKIIELLHYQESIFLSTDDIIDRLYPDAFSSFTEMYSKRFDVSKSTLLAVIKSESEFNHKAASGAGATGLMQLMPPTAKDISKKLNRQSYNMKSPQDSIQFGAYYIAWLNRFFKGNLRDIVAGYNAGPGNVLKWKQLYDKTDIDLYTEQIPFEETRGYVLYTEKYQIIYNVLLNKL